MTEGGYCTGGRTCGAGIRFVH